MSRRDLDATGTIDLQDPVDFHALVNGMQAGDLIDLINTTETGYGYNSGTLTVDSSAGVLNLRIAGGALPLSPRVWLGADE